MEYVIGKLLRDFEKGMMTRRQLIQSLSLAATAASALSVAPAAAAAAADGKVAQAASLNHLGYQVADYAKSRDWYADLFGMKVVVEGVETSIQLDTMRRTGCDMAQGYFIGRPAARPASLAFELQKTA